MKLEVAEKIVAVALAHARSRNMLPLCVAVLDARGATRALAAEDGTSIKRSNVAIGKAHGALAMGLGSRTLAKRAETHPHFIAAVTHAVGGSLIPVPGGVLIRDGEGRCSVRSAFPATPPTTTRPPPSPASRPSAESRSGLP
jgi:uncharacterized protein GlcG (DUF336 family)